MAERTIFLGIRPTRLEGEADGAITPGHLVKRDADGKYTVHATAGGNLAPFIAFEQELINEADVDTAYAAGDRFYFGVCQPGVQFYGFLKANAAAVVIGDFLESAGDGSFQKHTPLDIDEGGSTDHGNVYTNGVRVMAIEAVDNNAGGTQARCKMMFI